MHIVKTLREAAAKAAGRMEELATLAETENRDLTEDERKEFDLCAATVDRKTADADRIEKAAGASAKATAEPETPKVIKGVTTVDNGHAIEIPGKGLFWDEKKLTGLEKVGIMAWAAGRAKNYPTKSALQHLEEFGFGQLAEESQKTTDFLKQNKAFQSITVGGGDNVIDTPLSTDFIEFLYNESVFLSAGPVPIDLSFGSLDIPGGNASATAAYKAEGADPTYTQATTRKVSLSAKHLTAVTAISNYLLDVSPLPVAGIIGDNLVMAMSVAMDAAGLRADGTGNAPEGIASLLHASHVIAATAETSTGAPTLEEIDYDVKRMLTLLRGTNIPARRRRWMMSNRVFTYLQFVRDGNGNLAFPGLSAPQKTWYDNIPVSISEQVPSNLGTGTNESELYLTDFGHVLMGIARAIRLKSSTEASYIDGGATMRSAFSRDETVIRATGSHDFDMRHDKAGVLMEEVTWGA